MDQFPTPPAPTGGLRTLVALPTYNEIDSLAGVTSRLLEATPAHVELLVVDDASPDGTGRLADEIAAREPRVQVLHRAGKQGLGAAYRHAFTWAMERGYDVVVEMDADGSHLPEQLPRLLSALDRADLVLGSRWVPGGRVHDWPASRRMLSKGGNAYVRRALRVPLGDATSGFRAYRTDALRAVDLDTVASQGYCFQVDLARRVLRAGLRVREVPIDFHERDHGASKMTRSIVTEALWRVTVWGVADRVHGRRRAQAEPVAPPVVRVPEHAA